MSELAERYFKVKERVHEACKKAGRHTCRRLKIPPH